MEQKKGRFEKKKSHKGRTALLCISAVLICALGVFLLLDQTAQEKPSIFQKISRDGYTGTQEQWLASLVGEEAGGEDARTAYQMACEHGYLESETHWLETLTGIQSPETGKSPYAIACSNGYTGDLASWLTSIADAPEPLGHSKEAGVQTEYELACEYGYTGTYIEWLVSVAYDRAY